MDTRGRHGDTALQQAALKRDAPMAKLLIEQRAQVDLKDEKGRTALHWAAGYDHDGQVVEVLIQAGADVHVKDDRGYTPLDWARSSKVRAFLRERKPTE